MDPILGTLLTISHHVYLIVRSMLSGWQLDSLGNNNSLWGFNFFVPQRRIGYTGELKTIVIEMAQR